MNDEYEGAKLFLNIPIKVAHDNNLKANEKLLFGEIYSMLNIKDSFFMSNAKLAERLGCTARQIRNYTKHLEEEGYIYRKIIYKEDGKTIDKRLIMLGTKFNSLGVGNKNSVGLGTNIPQGEEQNFHIREQFKRTVNTNELEENRFDYDKFISWFNEITGRSFSSKALFKKYINARLNEGFTKEDIAKVVTFKAGKWKDTEMKEYLRPNTLFALSHFDNYLQEAKEGLPEPQKKKSNTSSARRPERTEEEERLYQLRLYASEHPEIYESDTEGNRAIREELERLERNRVKGGGSPTE